MDGNRRKAGDEFKDVIVSAGTAQTSQHIRLFDLPVELWLRICELAVTEDDRIGIQISDEGDWATAAVTVKQPAITRTCKIIRQEILPVFYRLNTFIVDDTWMGDYRNTKTLQRWLLVIGKDNARAMHTLHLYGWRNNVEVWKDRCSELGISVEMEVKGASSSGSRLLGAPRPRSYDTLSAVLTFL